MVEIDGLWHKSIYPFTIPQQTAGRKSLHLERTSRGPTRLKNAGGFAIHSAGGRNYTDVVRNPRERAMVTNLLRTTVGSRAASTAQSRGMRRCCLACMRTDRLRGPIRSASLVIELLPLRRPFLRCVFAAALLDVLRPVTACSQPFDAHQARSRASLDAFGEAAVALQGADARPFLDSAEVARAASALRGVRAQFPTLATAPAEGQFWAADLVVDRPTAAAVRRVAGRLRRTHWRTWELDNGRTGVAQLDTLNAGLAARPTHLELRGLGGTDTTQMWYRVRLEFQRAMHLPAALAQYRVLPGVIVAEPAQDIGPRTGNHYRARRSGTTWLFEIDVGTGDCRAECVRWTRHEVRYDEQTGVATLVDRRVVP